MVDQKVESMIENLENNGMVIVNVITFENGRVSIDYWDGKGSVVCFECITVDQYESNGFDVANVPCQVIVV